MCCLSTQRPSQEQFGLRPSQYRTILRLYALRRIAFQPQPRRTHAPTYSAHRCCCLALVMTIIQVLRQRFTALADLVSPLQNYQYTRSPRVKPTCVCLPLGNHAYDCDPVRQHSKQLQPYEQPHNSSLLPLPGGTPITLCPASSPDDLFQVTEIEMSK